jgi:hypothetical protein
MACQGGPERINGKRFFFLYARGPLCYKNKDVVSEIAQRPENEGPPMMRSLLLKLLLAGVAVGITAAASARIRPMDSEPAGKSRALILAGLPGDEEHATHFGKIAGAWREWLTGPLGFAAADVRLLSDRGGKEGVDGPATREAIQKEVEELKKVLRPEDRLWVFFLGHGNHDGDHAYFHLPGSDLRGEDLGKLFADVRCREQVFWMTTSASGWFLKSLSAKGRIVITATLPDDEFNETEFPEALANAAKLPLEKLDDNKDGKVSILELYRHILAEVAALFEADSRVPTEHALLDDNGDGQGTEEPVLPGEKTDKKPTADGPLAAKTFLPLKSKGTK